jgi:hypothetical protein
VPVAVRPPAGPRCPPPQPAPAAAPAAPALPHTGRAQGPNQGPTRAAVFWGGGERGGGGGYEEKLRRCGALHAASRRQDITTSARSRCHPGSIGSQPRAKEKGTGNDERHGKKAGKLGSNGKRDFEGAPAAAPAGTPPASAGPAPSGRRPLWPPPAAQTCISEEEGAAGVSSEAALLCGDALGCGGCGSWLPTDMHPGRSIGSEKAETNGCRKPSIE